MTVQPNIFNARILVVDDVESNVLLLEQMLSESGYQHINSTTDPYSVVELHRTNSFDLILLDLQMPGMDGFEVMKKLKLSKIYDHLNILVFTALIEQKWRSLAAGAKGCIAKPFDIVEINNCIRHLLKESLLIKQRHANQLANH